MGKNSVGKIGNKHKGKAGLEETQKSAKDVNPNLEKPLQSSTGQNLKKKKKKKKKVNSGSNEEIKEADNLNLKKITLRTTSDGKSFDVEEAALLVSHTLKHIIEEDGCADDGIDLHNVTGDILAKVINYCKKHAVCKPDSDINLDEKKHLKKWDSKFIEESIRDNVLFNIIKAAHFLGVEGLLNLACQRVADGLSHKTAQELCQIFQIPAGFTPEEIELIKRENPDFVI